MKIVIGLLGSMKTMALLMLVFAFTIGVATFIENDFGTQTAKAVVYNAGWFEALMLLLGINLLINILNFKMYRKEKVLVFLFHVSFFVILLGAAITRYVGFEGVMHIREGAEQMSMMSSETYLAFDVSEKGKRQHFSDALYLSKITDNTKSYTLSNGIEATIIGYIPDAVYTLEEAPGGKPTAAMMVTAEGMGQPEQLRLRQGDAYETPTFVIDFESHNTFDKPVVSLYLEGDTLKMKHDFNLRSMSMDDRSMADINASDATVLQTRYLYSAMQTSFVLRQFYKSAKEVLVSAEQSGSMRMNSMGGTDALIIELRRGDERKEVTVTGSKGEAGEPLHVTLGDVDIDVSYGAKVIELPFSLKLVDFQMERYPGSNSPSSYASEVILIDREQGIEEPFRIYMNHILDHRGYRFFQSSYDRDEMGTILSVNNDPGTLPTYIGYLMLAIGMFGSLFMPNGRFAKLSKKAKEASASLATVSALLALFIATPQAHAEELNPIVKTVLSFDAAHAQKFGELMVQDASGRMKPVDTLSNEIVAKINRSDTILGLKPTQIVLGMMLAPDAWREISMIRVGNSEINKIIGIDESAKYASFSQFFEFPSEMSGYKINRYIEEAIRKAPAKRNKFDKAVLQVDERVNVAYMVYTGALIKIWPAPNDGNNKWMATIEAMKTLQPTEAEAIRQLAVGYFNAVDASMKSGRWDDANKALDTIVAYQKEVGASIYPDETKIGIEILYNKLNIFERLWPYFFLIGFILLFLSFAKIIKPTIKIALATRITMALLIVFFISLTVGLAMRWYISGHAPWSDGYESLIYISWATVLAGFIFSKNSPITLAATGILAGLTLFVAHLSWMDPQVTNLVPVLKSYWLSIHVSMITGSYGFLGLGALLGFIALILFNLKNSRNEKQISASIKELNAINEMSLMIGLAMLTVGNFLGGVWANESWGRYWGWDPKETWALVTILVYAVVVHVRFIKKIYSDYSYSVISLLAFTSVIMTYFGVNYYLKGMHSYAKGDPVPIPEFVPITYGIIFVIILFAYPKRRLT